ncbi:MAG TPA: type I-B CRISPR-associated protein Cas7/Cst2/DevR [Mycobacteriales bacterium]|jgi:CRISPR-associated regulatory protein, DevR family
MTYLAGKVVLDVVAGAPNNGEGEDNVARTKQIRIGRDIYPYVSAQAFRRWLRDTMPLDEARSPVVRSGSGKRQQAYTAGHPHLYMDDDLFGYMVAVAKASYQRDTVLATGTLLAVRPQRPTSDFGTMTRGFGPEDNPVIHQHEHYTTELAGDLLLDLPRVGTFEVDGGGLCQAFPSAVADEVRANGGEDTLLRGIPCVRLPLAERRRRVGVLLRALASLRGGAGQALHYGDRTPAFVLIAPIKGGINPFTRTVRLLDGETAFDVDVFAEELDAWSDELDGPVRIGWAPGFLGDQRQRARRDLAGPIEAGQVAFEHPRTMLVSLATEIEHGDHDGWFDDPAVNQAADPAA